MSDIRGKRIMVVGGAGLIGSHIVDQLTDEDVAEVIIYDNFTRGTHGNLAAALKDPRVRVFDVGGDITQADILASAMKETDMVVHLAALWLLQCHEFPRAAFDVNIRGTFNVLEACRDAQIERLVYSSSASVYGNAQFTPMTEDHPYGNETFYGATKIAGEHMCRAFHHRYGLSYAGLRYMNVYGPRQDYKGAYIAVIMKILDCIDRGERPVVYGDGSQSYDFVYVGDVARANICALKSDATDSFYNVGTGIGTSIKELAETLVELTGSDLPIEYRTQEQSFVTHRIGSTQAAAGDLGFIARTPLAEGLKKVIEWRKADQDRANASALVSAGQPAQNEPPIKREENSASA